MIIKKIAKLCREQRSLVSVCSSGQLWVGTGAAMYLLDGLPDMSSEQIYTAFDYSQEVRNKIYFHKWDYWLAMIERNHSTSDIFEHDPEPAEIDKNSVYVFRKNGGGVILCNRELFSPFEDMKDDPGITYYYDCYNGTDMIVVAAGLMVVGVVLPMRILEERLCGWIEKQQRLLLEIQEEMERVRDYKPAESVGDVGQMDMFGEEQDHD